jgi:hypothetical protein
VENVLKKTDRIEIIVLSGHNRATAAKTLKNRGLIETGRGSNGLGLMKPSFFMISDTLTFSVNLRRETSALRAGIFKQECWLDLSIRLHLAA